LLSNYPHNSDGISEANIREEGQQFDNRTLAFNAPMSINKTAPMRVRICKNQQTQSPYTTDRSPEDHHRYETVCAREWSHRVLSPLQYLGSCSHSSSFRNDKNDAFATSIKAEREKREISD
jgi:hypothetical protein